MKIKLVKDENHKNKFIGKVIALCFAKTILLQFFHIFFGYESNTITYFVYMFLMAYLFAGVLYYHLVSFRGIVIWGVILALIGIGYLTCMPAAKAYFDNVEMYLIYIYYLPIAVFAVKNISDTNEVMRQIVKISWIVVLISLYMIFVRSYASLKQDNYMQFSYANIPFVMAAYYGASKFEKKFYYFVYAVGLLTIFLFGARLPLMICLAFPVLLFLFTQNDEVSRSKKILTGLVTVIVFGIVSLFWDRLFSLLNTIGGSMGSHVLAKLNGNIFFQSSTRSVIYDNAFELIKSSGGKAHGLFADRVYLRVAYVHNIFLEFFIDFGLIVGIVLSIILVVAIIKGFANKDSRDFLIFMMLAIFIRYMVSGSYLIEGLAYVYFAVVIKYGFQAKQREQTRQLITQNGES